MTYLLLETKTDKQKEKNCKNTELSLDFALNRPSAVFPCACFKSVNVNSRPSQTCRFCKCLCSLCSRSSPFSDPLTVEMHIFLRSFLKN